MYHPRGAYHPSEERKGVKGGRFNPCTLASSSFAALLVSSFPVSRRTNSSPIVSGNLWKSLNVQDGIHAGEVSFLSSIFFFFFFRFFEQQLLVVVVLFCPVDVSL